jgi:hypothetical protein
MIKTFIHVLPLNHHKSVVIFLVTIIIFLSTNERRLKGRHLFFIELQNGYENNLSILKGFLPSGLSNIYFFKGNREMISCLSKYKNVELYFHQLPSVKLRFLFFIYYTLIRKIQYNWIAWGGDLYDNNYYRIILKDSTSHRSLKNTAVYFVNKLFVRKLKFICSIPDDYKTFKLLYLHSTAVHKRFFYPNKNILKFSKTLSSYKKNVNILISHSASKENNHLEIIERLEGLKECDNVTIYAVLSYGGDMNYINSIVSEGKKKFGKNFIPIVNFMDLEQYNIFLEKIDIAYFASNRQSSLFTSVTMLSAGVKMILKSSTSTYSFFIKNGVKVYDFNQTSNIKDILNIDFHDIERNSKIIKNMYSEKSILRMYQDIFK